MKKFATIAIIALAGAIVLPSCKKDYTCTCTLAGSTTPTELKGYKKSDAKDACDKSNTAISALGGSCKLD